MKFCLFFALALNFSANAQEYKRLHRTYVDFSQIDLTACKQSFRFLNGNHMDCRLDLPQGQRPDGLSKISPAFYEPTNVTLTTTAQGYVAYVDMRDSAFDYLDASLSTHLILSMYYELPDKPGYMQTLPAENYEWSVFEKFLRQALGRIAERRSWKTSSAVIALPWTNPMVDEKVIGSIFVARDRIPVRVEDCESRVSTELVDAWPEQDYWITKCTFQNVLKAHGEAVPLNIDYWAESLFPAQTKTIYNQGLTFTHSAWGWNVEIHGKRTWADIEALVKETFAKVGTEVFGYYIVDEAMVDHYGSSDWTLGKLVYKNGRLDIEPNRN